MLAFGLSAGPHEGLTDLLLSDRQKKILYRISIGRKEAKIADELGYSVSALVDESKRIYDQMSENDRHKVVIRAIALGLIKG
jgi:DNA-binding NarL/FixJ family response regulator